MISTNLFNSCNKGLTKLRTPGRRKNWADDLGKLAAENITLCLVLVQKSELSLRIISNKPCSFILCEKKPA